MKYIELFAGIGGFRYGLEKVGQFQQKMEQSRGSGDIEGIEGKPQFTCVYANEWDKYACQIYRKNFGNKELHEGDIRTIPAESIPNHDLLVGGFPCQAFSIAGKRKGFGDTCGTLFFEICRIVEEKKPNLLLLENVKGLLNHDGGNTFRIILNSLSELGYDCEWEVLNSKNFGVPQNRERVFIVGHFRGTSGGKVFPIGEGSKEVNELCGQQTGAITARRGSAKSDGDYIVEGNRKTQELEYIGAVMSEQNQKWLNDGKELSRNFPQGQRVYSKNGIASTIARNAGGLGGKTGLYMINSKGKTHQQDLLQDSNGVSRSILAGTHGSTPHLLKTIMPNNKIRRLTPIECERLQGFPDGWTEGVSDTQRYKCLGNAVTTNVITEIGKKILKE